MGFWKKLFGLEGIKNDESAFSDEMENETNDEMDVDIDVDGNDEEQALLEQAATAALWLHLAHVTKPKDD